MTMIKKELNPKCGKRLSECRNLKNITQEQLSEKSGYSIQHISYIECGKRNLTLEAAHIFAQALDVREEYLLCEDNSMTLTDFAKHISTTGPLADIAAIFGFEIAELGLTKDEEETSIDKVAYTERMNELEKIVEEIRDFASFKLNKLFNKESE